MAEATTYIGHFTCVGCNAVAADLLRDLVREVTEPHLTEGPGS
jgi:hypothetical protein